MTVRFTLGLLGHPVSHSLSPTLHQAAAKPFGLDLTYTLVDTPPEALPTRLSRLHAEGWHGLNLTVPLKETARSLLVHQTPAARAVGAVNTLWPTADGWCGDNTDVQGVDDTLGERTIKRAVLLGAGGAARAVLFALVRRGVDAVAVLNRTPSRAESLIADLAPSVGVADGLDTLARHLRGADLLVDCTGPGARQGVGPAGLLPERCRPDSMAPGALVFDLAYGALPMPALALARQAGVQAVDGLEMLIGQGLAAFERWTGLRPNRSGVREALAAAVQTQTASR